MIGDAENDESSLYLLVIPDTESIPDRLSFHGDGKRLAEGLYVIQSSLSRSKLYHRIKWQLPDATALLVARLDGSPKFKGMAKGALAWLRAKGV